MIKQTIIFLKINEKSTENRTLFFRWCNIKKLRQKRVRFIFMMVIGHLTSVLITFIVHNAIKRIDQMPDYKKNPSKYKITYREGLLGTYKTYTEK